MRRVFLIFVAALPAMAYADGWSNSMQILDIYTYGSSDTILVKTSNTTVYDTASNCRPELWHVVANTEERRQRIYATLLTAQASGKPVRFWWTAGCGTSDAHQTDVIRMMGE